MHKRLQYRHLRPIQYLIRCSNQVPALRRHLVVVGSGRIDRRSCQVARPRCFGQHVKEYFRRYVDFFITLFYAEPCTSLRGIVWDLGSFNDIFSCVRFGIRYVRLTVAGNLTETPDLRGWPPVYLYIFSTVFCHRNEADRWYHCDLD